MLKNHYTVAVIGSSLAGSTIARQLALFGIDVALIDKNNFPRSKTCGEGLSPIALSKLSQFGIIEQLLTSPHKKIHGYNIHLKDGYLSNINFQDEQQIDANEFGLGISRFILDKIVLDKAISTQGVHAFIGNEVNKIESKENYFNIHCDDQILTAKKIVLACGANSKFPRMLNVPEIKKDSPRWGMSFSVKTDQGVKTNLVRIIPQKRIQIIITPVSNNNYNISIMGSKHISKPPNSENIEQILNQCSESMGDLLIQDSDPLYVSSIGRYRRMPVYNNIFTIGDCLEQLDPVGGMGMTSAILSAEKSASTIISILDNQKLYQPITKIHSTNLNNILRPLRGFTRLSYLHLNFAQLLGTKAQKLLQPFAAKLIRGLHKHNAPIMSRPVFTSMMLNIIGTNL
jgi:menaquinone-9 beta-reductase